MSRKLRVAKHQTLPLPDDMWTYFLLVGPVPEGVRLADWVSFFQAGQYGKPTAEQVWERHHDALTAVAEEHGFTPYWPTRRKPRGEAVAAWAKAFIAEHQY